MPKQSQHVRATHIQYAKHLAGEIGNRIRQRRIALGLDQASLRTRLEREQVFVSRATLSRMENGAHLPDVAEAIAMTKALEVSFSWLLLGSE